MEVSHIFGADIDLSASGDLLLVDGLTLSQQAVLRRLLTNPLNLPFDPTYGGGLGAFVGSPVHAAVIQGIISAQMALEQDVDQSSAPTVTVSSAANQVSVLVQYVSLTSGQTVLGFDLSQTSITITAS
jgi:hypothetical protein